MTEIASETRTVSAMPGPKARKNSSSPATSAAVPPATIRPAVTTIGRYSEVDACAASRPPLAAEALFHPVQEEAA